MNHTEVDKWIRTGGGKKPSDSQLADGFARIAVERLAEMKKAGIKRVRYLGSGNHDECPVCSELIDQIFPIDKVRNGIPADCICRPYCKCILIAVE